MLKNSFYSRSQLAKSLFSKHQKNDFHTDTVERTTVIENSDKSYNRLFQIKMAIHGQWFDSFERLSAEITFWMKEKSVTNDALYRTNLNYQR